MGKMVIYFFAVLFVSAGCLNKNTHGHSSDVIVAWNEDTDYPATIKIYNNGSFVFSVKTPTHTDIAKGKIKYTDDRLYLVYNEEPPVTMSNMLIEAPCGKYLIQLASANHPRLVMRIQEHVKQW